MPHPKGASLEKMTEQRPDGAVWTHFLSERSHIIITAAGRKLFRDDKTLLKTIREYRQDVVGASKGNASGKKPLRQHFASGGNSDVYAAGASYAVKEALSTQSLHSALDRMATIQNVMERGCSSMGKCTKPLRLTDYFFWKSTVHAHAKNRFGINNRACSK